MEFTSQVTPDGFIVPKTGLTNLTEQNIRKMPASEAHLLMGLIAAEYRLNMQVQSEYNIAYRMLVHFAKYN